MNISIEGYIKKEELFFQALSAIADKDVYLYCNTGSLGRGEIIPEWSDIDVLLVIKEYNKAIFEHINAALKKTGDDIKIGLTIFSLEEFNHAYFKDSKTYISIRLIREGRYQPRIMKPEIQLLHQNKIVKKYMDISDFSRFSHDIKRELLKKENYDEKKVYKLTIILLKICLYRKGIITLGYKETAVRAIKNLPGFEIKIPKPEAIFNDPGGKNKRYQIYLKILEWLRKNTNVIFQ